MRLLTLVAISTVAITAMPSRADQPFGWAGNGHASAYALHQGEFELSGNLLRVNDNFDFLNLRDELLAGTQRLVGNSGDLTGNGGELRIGVWDSLEIFYREQSQDLTLNIGPVSSADIENLDNALRTERKAFGAKWVFYEAISQDRSRPWTSAALELTRTQNSSDDFGGDLTSFRLGASGSVTLDPAQRFSMDRLRDKGWQARVLLSRPFGEFATASLWAGYGEADSSSGTSSEIDLSFLRDAFLQTFDVRETQYRLGASLNWQRFPRLPVQIGYEYIDIADREQDIVSGNSTLIPSFLRGDNLADSSSSNHALYGSVNWWITPRLYIGATGNLFSSQFTGVIPHYNNPLSSSFADTYGYVELKLGFKFSIGERR
jgi:hypothetical protein